MGGFVMLLLVAGVQPGAGEVTTMKPEKVWAGMLPDESLRLAAPESGVIIEEAAFTSIWDAWRPGEATPEVHFDKSFVLVGTIDGPNRMFVGLTLEDGDLRPQFGGTKVAGRGFGYILALVPREGVKTIRGRALAKPRTDAARNRPEGDRRFREVVRVAVQGTIETGIVAIGGETTGTVVRSNGMTFELEFGDEVLQAQADRLNSEPVLVTGELTVREGVERGPRWVIEVDWVDAADGGSAERQPVDGPPDEGRETVPEDAPGVEEIDGASENAGGKP